MLTYGLKLWNTNTELFSEARREWESGTFGAIELYTNPTHPFNESELRILQGIPVTIHAPHSGMFHEFVIGAAERQIWSEMLRTADFFESQVIVVHPGRAHSFETFRENLALIEDPRILIENMAGLDLNRNPMFGQQISDLIKIRDIKAICFDFEKAAKAAYFQHLPYKEYITEAISVLSPTYFHISGGMSDSAVDEHTNLWDCDLDIRWIRESVPTVDATIVFETPKEDGIANDLKNMHYFRTI